MRFALPALVLMALLPGLPAAAQTAVPVKITADTFVVDDKSQEAIFSGNVLVVRSTMTVWADKVVVNFGAGGPEDISEFVATGNVRIKTGEQDATGRRAVFNPQTQVLRLTDNVKVVNASGTVSAAELVVNLETNQTVFSGGGNNRVTGVFTPR